MPRHVSSTPEANSSWIPADVMVRLHEERCPTFAERVGRDVARIAGTAVALSLAYCDQRDAAGGAGAIPATTPVLEGSGPAASPVWEELAELEFVLSEPRKGFRPTSGNVFVDLGRSLLEKLGGPFLPLEGRSKPTLTAGKDVTVRRVGNGYHLMGALPGRKRPDLGENREARNAFATMAEAARQDGVTLTEVSNYRSIKHQQRLWNKSDKSGHWVARPGSSEHHTGLAFDIGTPRTTDASRLGGFASTPAYRWLAENAYRYGFVQSMSWEAWHWRYDPQAVSLSLRQPAVG